MDVRLFRQMGEEFKRRFADKSINKILTIEASGIGIAVEKGVSARRRENSRDGLPARIARHCGKHGRRNRHGRFPSTAIKGVLYETVFIPRFAPFAQLRLDF